VSKRTASPGLGSLAAGAVTAAALAVQTGLAAVVGVIIAREFGRSAETDGFFAAYGVFIVVVLAATAIRIAVLPALARARAGRRLGAEVGAYASTLATIAVPLIVLGLAASHPLAWLLTGDGAAEAKDTAAAALPWMVGASVLQLYAGLAASSLAALDDYLVAAAGYAAGSVAGLGYILVRVDADGIDAVSRGMLLNGVIAAVVPAVALARRARAEAMPVSAIRPVGLSFWARIAELGVGVSLPLALQAVYVVCLPFAGREGTGATTSFGYAYLIGSAIVAVTASSLGLVTSVPLTRDGVDASGAVRHVVSSSWLAVIAIGGVVSVFGVAGERILHAVLGAHYGASVGTELGRLVVVLTPWALVSVGVSVAFPLIFVVDRGRILPLVAVTAVAVHVPIALLGQRLGGLDGLEVALAVTTLGMLIALLAVLHALRGAARGLVAAAVTVGAMAALAFVPPAFVLGRVAAAACGLALYAALLALARPRGARAAWRYLHQLG
jgi:putative peptidoglycan lipid II flippase